VQAPPLWHQAVGDIAQQAAQIGAEGIRQRDMGNGTVAKKAVLAARGFDR